IRVRAQQPTRREIPTLAGVSLSIPPQTHDELSHLELCCAWLSKPSALSKLTLWPGRNKAPAAAAPFPMARCDFAETVGAPCTPGGSGQRSNLHAVLLGVAFELGPQIAFGRWDRGAQPAPELAGIEAHDHRFHRADRGWRHRDGAIAKTDQRHGLERTARQLAAQAEGTAVPGRGIDNGCERPERRRR